MTLIAEPLLGGLDDRIGDNRIVERDDLAIVSLAVAKGAEGAVAESLDQTWGLAMPDARVSTVSGDMRAVSMAADQMFLIAPGDGPQMTRDVKAVVGDAGYTTDQSDGWICLEVSGPQTLAALERICMIDLLPEQFPVHAAARTVMEHMGALIIRLGADHFLLLSASSSAQSFAESVAKSYRYVTL